MFDERERAVEYLGRWCLAVPDGVAQPQEVGDPHQGPGLCGSVAAGDLTTLLCASQVGRVGVGQGLVVLTVDGFVDELRLHDDPVEVLVVEREGNEGGEAVRH